ncbi:hypothetical protein [Streptomyces albidoflavus]|uniref:hypothetical protein n=1 Tax=Streptomyces albidoflavus TaxID=1886 RepID=UPI0033A7F50D
MTLNVASGLARALADIIVSIELTDDEVIDPEIASAILDDTTAIFDSMSNSDRAEIARLILEYAEEQSRSDRKRVMLGVPDGLGLLDEDE